MYAGIQSQGSKVMFKILASRKNSNIFFHKNSVGQFLFCELQIFSHKNATVSFNCAFQDLYGSLLCIAKYNHMLHKLFRMLNNTNIGRKEAEIVVVCVQGQLSSFRSQNIPCALMIVHVNKIQITYLLKGDFGRGRLFHGKFSRLGTDGQRWIV